MSAMLDIVIKTLNPKQAYELIAAGEVDVVDVREPAEWSQGHLEGARLVPLAQLRANPKAVLARDNVLFVCAAGVRSETAARVAASLGLKTLFSLGGGTRAWVKAGLPIVAELDVAV
jgi:rhodanese-related sulfurtransferase